MGGAELFEESAGVAGELEDGRAQLVGDDLDVVPGEAVAPARAERLERGLLRGEARGVVLRGRRPAARVAVGALRGGEDALAETRRAREHFTHAPDFDNVYAYGDDHD